MELTIERIAKVIMENIQVDNIIMQDINGDLVEYGLDSLGFIRVIVALEEEFGCEIPDSELKISKMNTIHKIYDVLKGAVANIG